MTLHFVQENRLTIMRKVFFVLLLSTAAFSQTSTAVCKACIRAHEHFLASDTLQGRGSATANETLAAEYIAAQLEQYGIQPGTGTGYIQVVQQDVDLTKLPLDRMPAQLSRAFKNAVHNGKLTTRNVIGIIPGTDPKLKNEFILLSAHMDHMGVIPEEAIKGDDIFNGADDDASGVTAVLELARALGSDAKPKRSIVFTLFGSEELGGFGARYFHADDDLAHLDFDHMADAIGSMIEPVRWLANSDFTPQWVAGQKP